MQRLETRRVERGERQGEGEQSGAASWTSSDVDGRRWQRCAAIVPGLHDEPVAAAPQAIGSLSLVHSSPLPAGQSCSSYSGRFGGGQAALPDETLGQGRSLDAIQAHRHEA